MQIVYQIFSTFESEGNLKNGPSKEKERSRKEDESTKNTLNTLRRMQWLVLAVLLGKSGLATPGTCTNELTLQNKPNNS